MSESLISVLRNLEEAAALCDRWGFPNYEDFEAFNTLSAEKRDAITRAEVDAIDLVDRELGLFLPGQREDWENMRRNPADWSPRHSAFLFSVRMAARFRAAEHERSRDQHGGGK